MTRAIHLADPKHLSFGSKHLSFGMLFDIYNQFNWCSSRTASTVHDVVVEVLISAGNPWGYHDGDFFTERFVQYLTEIGLWVPAPRKASGYGSFSRAPVREDLVALGLLLVSDPLLGPVRLIE